MLGQVLVGSRGVGRAGGRLADQAAFDLAVGLALCAPSRGVGAGRWVGAEPGQDHGVQGLVELTVPGAVRAGPGPSGPRRRGWGRPRPAWRRRHRAAAARMGPGAQHRGGHDRAHPGPGEQVGRQARTSAIAACGRRPRRSAPGSDGPSSARWRRWWRSQRPSGLDAQPGAGGHQLAGRADPEPFSQDVGCGDHQRVQLALGVAGGLDRRAAGGQPHRQGGPLAGRSGLGELITAEHLTGGPIASSGSDLAPWRRAARLGRSSSTTCSGGHAGTGSGRRRSRRCSRSPRPAGRAGGSANSRSCW